MMVKNPIEYAKLLNDVYAGKYILCPECGKQGVEHHFFSSGKDNVGFAQFHCPHCNAEAHLSRVKFPKGVQTEDMY